MDKIVMPFYKFDPFATWVVLTPTFRDRILSGDPNDLFEKLIAGQKRTCESEGRRGWSGIGVLSNRRSSALYTIRTWSSWAEEVKIPLWVAVSRCKDLNIKMSELKNQTLYWSSPTSGGGVAPIRIKIRPKDLHLNKDLAFLFGLLSKNFSFRYYGNSIHLTICRRAADMRIVQYFQWLAVQIRTYLTKCFGKIEPKELFLNTDHQKGMYKIQLPSSISHQLFRFLNKYLLINEPDGAKIAAFFKASSLATTFMHAMQINEEQYNSKIPPPNPTGPKART